MVYAKAQTLSSPFLVPKNIIMLHVSHFFLSLMFASLTAFSNFFSFSESPCPLISVIICEQKSRTIFAITFDDDGMEYSSFEEVVTNKSSTRSLKSNVEK